MRKKSFDGMKNCSKSNVNNHNNNNNNNNNNNFVNQHDQQQQISQPKPLLKTSSSFVESSDKFIKRKGTGRRLSFSDECGQNLTEVSKHVLYFMVT